MIEEGAGKMFVSVTQEVRQSLTKQVPVHFGLKKKKKGMFFPGYYINS